MNSPRSASVVAPKELSNDLHGAAICAIDGLVALTNAADARDAERVASEIQEFEDAYLHLAGMFDEMSSKTMVALGEANHNETIECCGRFAPSYFELAFWAIHDWRKLAYAAFGVFLEVKPESVIQTPGEVFVFAWPVTSRLLALRLPMIEQERLRANLLTESRRFVPAGKDISTSEKGKKRKTPAVEQYVKWLLDFEANKSFYESQADYARKNGIDQNSINSFFKLAREHLAKTGQRKP